MSEQEEREFWNAVDPYDHELAKELTKTFQRLTELSDEDMEEDNRSITIRKALVVFVRVLEAVRSIVDERRVAEPTHRTVVAIGEIARMYTAVTDTGAVRRRLVMIVQQAAQSVAREFREPREPGDHNEP
ncbi:MAG: hypothetical protein JWN04_4824, partial [Myxococcaceae bacterium]|nr:hypothetical protein [Myxococcaceae bacterium]